jgi:hypothetical protein
MKIEFNIKIPTTKGMLFTMYHERDTEKANAGTTQDQDERKEPTINITKVHEMLGHRNENATRITANALGWKITRGTLGVCQACTEP